MMSPNPEVKIKAVKNYFEIIGITKNNTGPSEEALKQMSKITSTTIKKTFETLGEILKSKNFTASSERVVTEEKEKESTIMKLIQAQED